MLAVFGYTLVAALFSFALVYLSFEIRKKDKYWMRNWKGDLDIGVCVLIAVFWPLTILIAFAVLSAKLLFDKEN